MSLLKVMLVDDHEVVRMGLRMVLEQVPDTQIVAEVGSAEEAIRLCEIHQPHVVIMDIRMPPGSSGIEACRIITERWRHIQVIMLTSFADDTLIADAIRAGAVGYVLKQAGTGELVRALDAVRQGAALLDPAITRRVLAMMRRQGENTPDPFEALTERELEVLHLLAQGHNNAEIAAALVLSDKTVRNHISGILDKLNVTNRVEAATYAIRNDIVSYRHSRS
ncbi:MAG: response regulator transcription factor [Anaerolineae bacterium]|nr:MAG: response regulator transcription factor [Anaerolineae bacterium]